MKKKKQPLPTHCKCIANTGRKEITIDKIYEIIGFEKDSRDVNYYKIISDTGKVRHYEVNKFEVIDENTNTP